jgi:hypothetical protein
MTTPTAEQDRATPVPAWTRALDEPGRRAWPRPTDEERRRARRAGYVGSILVNLLLLYAADHLLDWRVAFVTPAWADVLWAVDLSLQASIVANALFLVYDAGWFRRLVEVVAIGCALVAGYQLYALFPFDFGAWDALARLGLLGVVLALAIALVVVAVLTLVEVVAGALRAGTGAT